MRPTRLAILVLVITTALFGMALPSRADTDPLAAARACQTHADSGLQAFTACWVQRMFSPGQREIATCYAHAQTVGEVSVCAHGVPLDKQEDTTIGCAAKSDGSVTGFAECVGSALLDPAEESALACIDESADVLAFGACVAGNGVLSPEERVMMHCALATSGEPVTLASCVGGELTLTELRKCVAVGIGGHGCFGGGNTARKLVRDAWYDVGGAPEAGAQGLAKARDLGRALAASLTGCNWFRHPLGC